MSKIKQEEKLECVVYNDMNEYWAAQVIKRENKVNYSKIVKLKNKNDTAELISYYKEKKLIKNCANLSIEGDYYFYPSCEESSLEWNHLEGLAKAEIARQLNISRTSVRRLLIKNKKSHAK